MLDSDCLSTIIETVRTSNTVRTSQVKFTGETNTAQRVCKAIQKALARVSAQQTASRLLVLHLDEVDGLFSGKSPAVKKRDMDQTLTRIMDILEGKVSEWCPKVEYVVIVWTGNLDHVS